ncbi:MAG: hypothetical protein ACTHWZ_09100 [Peptoniphilaceae bacterium]
MEISEKAKGIVNFFEPSVKVTENHKGDHSKEGGKEDRHSHEHIHEHSHSLPSRITSIRLIIGVVIFVVAMFYPKTGIYRLPIFLLSYILIGGDVLLKAARNILRGQVFDENFLMSIATVGAFAI